MAPENTKKIPKKKENGNFWALFVFCLYFFRIFRGPTWGGGFCIFFVIFSYFQDPRVFGLCTSPGRIVMEVPILFLWGLHFTVCAPSNRVFNEINVNWPQQARGQERHPYICIQVFAHVIHNIERNMYCRMWHLREKTTCPLFPKVLSFSRATRAQNAEEVSKMSPGASGPETQKTLHKV